MSRDLPHPGLSSRPSRAAETDPDRDAARLLGRMRAGDGEAEGLLIALLYKDLRALAARRMRRERPDHTWQATELVHEALLRLRGDGTLQKAGDRAFLLMAASKAMQQLLIDHHRRHSAGKRGGRRRKHPLDAAFDRLARVDRINPVDLRDELEALGRLDARACMVVHLRFFLGMSPADVAESLGITQRTVERDWNFARAWLRDRLEPTEVPWTSP
jgi:RNA polymerase sigma factor (TIGR02999 family)